MHPRPAAAGRCDPRPARASSRRPTLPLLVHSTSSPSTLDPTSCHPHRRRRRRSPPLPPHGDRWFWLGVGLGRLKTVYLLLKSLNFSSRGSAPHPAGAGRPRPRKRAEMSECTLTGGPRHEPARSCYHKKTSINMYNFQNIKPLTFQNFKPLNLNLSSPKSF